MHPGIRITKVEVNNHGATLKNILPEKMNAVKCRRVEIFFKWGNGCFLEPL